MGEILVAIESVSGDSMTRELAQRVNQIDGAEGLLQRSPSPAGAKGSVGEIASALIKLATEKAIGPLIELLGHFITRDKRARIKIKLANGTELEVESSNVQEDLEQLRRLLRDLLSHAKP